MRPEDVEALSQPQDRAGALGVIGCLWKAGSIIDRVTYAGKPISRVQLEDLVFDAHMMLSLLLCAEKHGISVETVWLDHALSKEVGTETIRQTAKALAVPEHHAAEILLRRVPRGLNAISKQQTP